MTDKQFRTLKSIAKILAIIIGIYFIWYHPLFTFIMFLTLILITILFVIVLKKASDYFQDIFSNSKRR